MDANETAFVDRLSKAFPAVARLRSEHVRENRELLSHPFLGDVARYAISLFRSKGDVASQELRKLCSFMEKEYASGTPSVRALIALGFLENLAGPPEPHWRIRSVLGPELHSEIEEMWPSGR